MSTAATRRHAAPASRRADAPGFVQMAAIKALQQPAVAKALSPYADALQHPLEAASHAVERLVEAAPEVAPIVDRGVAAVTGAAAEVEHAAEQWIEAHWPARVAAAAAKAALTQAADTSTRPGGARAKDASKAAAMAALSEARRTAQQQQQAGMSSPAAAAVGTAAMMLLNAASGSDVFSGTNLQWVYQYAPAVLQKVLQPNLHAPVPPGAASWVASAVKDAATAALGTDQGLLNTLAAPSWGATESLQQMAWHGVHALIGFAVFRLLSAGSSGVSRLLKLVPAWIVGVAALRAPLWTLAIVGLRSLPLGVASYAFFALVMLTAAAVSLRIDKRAAAALVGVTAWAVYSVAQFASMLFLNRA